MPSSADAFFQFTQQKKIQQVFLVLPQRVQRSNTSLCSAYFTNGFVFFYFPKGFHANSSRANARLTHGPLQTFLFCDHLLRPHLLCVSATLRDGLDTCQPCKFVCVYVGVGVCVCPPPTPLPSCSLLSTHLWCDLISLWHGLNFPLGGTRKPLPSSDSVNGVWGWSESLDP